MLPQHFHFKASLPPHHRPSFGCTGGFTLMELLVVIGIMAIMMGLVVPAINGLKGSGNFDGAMRELAGVLEPSRAYAMANNTHVFVGIEEVDARQSTSAIPQTPATTTNGGRVIVVAVASRDGTSGYDSNTLTSGTSLSSSSLLLLGKVRRIENLHLLDLNASTTTPPATGGMARSAVDPASRVGNAKCVSLTPFNYPLSGTAQYKFTVVIEFGPQGSAKIVSQNGASLSKIIEIGIQPTHQNAIPVPPSNQAVGSHGAIQIDGLTGNIRTYKP